MEGTPGSQFPEDVLNKIEDTVKKVEQDSSSVSDAEIEELESQFNEGLLDVKLERSEYLAEHPEDAKDGEVEELKAYFVMMKEKAERQKKEIQATSEAEEVESDSQNQEDYEIVPNVLENFNKAIETPNIPEDEREKFRQEFLSRANGKAESVAKGIMGQIMLRAMKKAKELK